MALCKRLIARLDIKGGRLIKGIRFEGLRVLGDPCEAALRYSNEGADELLYVDAVASLYGRNSLSELLRSTSRELFIPITAGGGVRSVADAASLLSAGADKIAVNTAALKRPTLISELAEVFGSQCVVASIQARRTGSSSWEAMAEAGRERTGKDVLFWIEQLQKLGAGEILLTSVDQDGTCSGPDVELQSLVTSKAKIPLILSGGFNHPDQINSALQHNSISAVSIGAALHHGHLQMSRLKQDISHSPDTLPIRSLPLTQSNKQTGKTSCLKGKNIGVIDYGMGNQQSLVNAFEYLGASVYLTSDTDILSQTDLVALPGVGAFPNGIHELTKRNLDSWLKKWIQDAKPLIGICLGMQMLFDKGEEFCLTSGLGLLNGTVVSLAKGLPSSDELILPHMGWNRLTPGDAFKDLDLPSDLYQYFVHSFVATQVDPENILFKCQYGHESFVAGVLKNSVCGLQFHPERGGDEGLQILGSICDHLINL